MTEPLLRRSRMWRAYWILRAIQILVFATGMGFYVSVVLWWNGTLRLLPHVGWQALSKLDGAQWFISFMVGAFCAGIVIWVWAELMRRSDYLSEDELTEMKEKWIWA